MRRSTGGWKKIGIPSARFTVRGRISFPLLTERVQPGQRAHPRPARRARVVAAPRSVQALTLMIDLVDDGHAEHVCEEE